MLKCRALFIEVLVLAALVLFLLFFLFGRHHTVTTVVSGGELSGGYAETGDRIAFRTLYRGDPGYTVNFSAPYPCQDSDGKDITTLSVSGGKTTYCTVTAPSGQEGSGVVFSYTITQGAGAVVEPSQNHKGRGKEGEFNDSANPCKLCSPVVGGGDGDGGDAMAGAVKAKKMSSSNNVTATITCSNGTSGPAVVTPATVTLGNNAELNWLAGGNWTAYSFVPVPPSSNTACSDGNSFSSTGDYSYCKVKDPGTYTYSVHLDGCAKDGTNGSLTILAAHQVPIVLSPDRGVDRTEGFAGHTFTPGDVLTWKALEESTKASYQLSFDVKNPACNVPKGTVVTVTPTQSFSCQGMGPADKGKIVHYKILGVIPTPAKNPPNPIPGPPPGPPPFGVTVDSATPCKICNQ
jgi:hypothetical protein